MIITNAVAGHLEGFGSLDGVVEEKLSLSDGAELAVVGLEPPALAAGARQRRAAGADRGARGRRPGAGRGRAGSRRAAGADVRLRSAFTLAARGLHQADNAVRVWAVAEELALDLQAVAARAWSASPCPVGAAS